MTDADDRRPTPSEVELLWAAAAPYPDLDRVREAARDADVAYVLDAAALQRVAPLVLRALHAADVYVDPDASWAASQDVAWQAHARLALPAAAAAALGPLTEAGLEPLLLKGLSLVERYPGPGLRPMDDIDVLVPKEDREVASTALERAGWRRAKHAGPDLGYDVAFAHPAVPGVPLELHYDFAERRERPVTFEGAKLWAARRPTTVFGRPAWKLPPELELVVLIAHAAKGFHVFGRMLWIADLVVVAETSKLDWDSVARIAVDARRRVATTIALRMADRLGADVPEGLISLPRALGRMGVVEAILDPERPFFARPKAPWLPYALVDDLGGMIRLGLGDLRRPPWDKTRLQVAEQLVRMVAGGAPRMIRARLSGRRGG